MLSRKSKRLVQGIRKAIGVILVPFKWFRDSRGLPLTVDHYELYKIVHVRHFQKLGHFPDLVDCKDYNDKIQWLKLFDQSRDVIICSDKVTLRQFVEGRLGKGFTPNLYQVGEKFSDINFSTLPSAFVIKTNHDSGTVILVRDKKLFDIHSVGQRITQSLERRYGWKKGEWAYSLIKPMVFAEEYLDPETTKSPPDYKFHCVNGKVEWLQYIYDRGFETKEILTDRNGAPIDLWFDRKMQRGSGFECPSQWADLVAIAENLATGFKYVRVDLYLINGRTYVGEMTFYPKNGCYTGADQVMLGRLVNIDRSTVKPFISDRISRQKYLDN